MKLIDWLRDACARYDLDPHAIYRKKGDHGWPLTAKDEDELERKLREGDHFIALPREPAALANVIEVSIVDYLLKEAEVDKDIIAKRGTERGYPDIEISGKKFGDGFHAVDVKVARFNKRGTQTKSRITLYTGNTFFRHPKLKWPGTFRPFEDYASHIDVIALYKFNEQTLSRIDEMEIIVQEPWRIASKELSSTTREYIGAVQSVSDLRTGKGAFKTEDEFYKYWRKFPFKIGRAVEQQLAKILAGPATPKPK